MDYVWGKVYISPWADLLLSDIKLGGLRCFTLQPQTWQGFPAENDVLDRNIETKETLYGENPDDVVNDELSVFVQVISVELEQDDGSIVSIDC